MKMKYRKLIHDSADPNKESRTSCMQLLMRGRGRLYTFVDFIEYDRTVQSDDPTAKESNQRSEEDKLGLTYKETYAAPCQESSYWVSTCCRTRAETSFAKCGDTRQ